MKSFYDLSDKRKTDIFNQVSTYSGLPPAAIEKDWWVTLTLKAIFSLPFSNHIVFKGGTSLSKGWKLIERFSEDIDLAIDWKLLEFFEDGRLELYNLKNDIGEHNNLAEKMPEKTNKLHRVLVQWRKSVNAPVPTQLNPEYNPDTE